MQGIVRRHESSNLEPRINLNEYSGDAWDLAHGKTPYDDMEVIIYKNSYIFRKKIMKHWSCCLAIIIGYFIHYLSPLKILYVNNIKLNNQFK